MDASLQPSKLAGLPSLIRKHAEAAARGSQPSFQRIMKNLVSLNQLSYKEVGLLLPVFYSTLDTQPLANLRESMAADDDSEALAAAGELVWRVRASIDALSLLMWYKGIPESAVTELWARLWPWIDLIDEYLEALPALAVSDYPLQHTHVLITSVIYWIGKLQPFDTPNDIARVPGFFRVVARGWRYLLFSPDPALAREHAWKVVIIMNRLDRYARLGHMRDMVRGAGGSHSDLAALIVGQFAHVFPAPDTPVTQTTVEGIAGLSRLIAKGIFPTGEHNESYVELGDAMWALKFGRRLTYAMRSLESCRVPATRDTASMLSNYYFGRLALGFVGPRGREIFIEALRAGYLHVILSRAADNGPHSSAIMLRNQLQQVLPQLTVYRSVVKVLRTASGEIIERERGEKGTWTEDMRVAWTGFGAIATQRKDFLDRYEGMSEKRLKMCCNTACGKFVDRASMGSCGGCRSAVYCSRECQRGDWLAHKAICLSKTAPPPSLLDLTRNDRSFLKSLLNYEYRVNQQQIAMDLLAYFYTHPAPTSLPCTLFDLSIGWSQIRVAATPPTGALGPDDGAAQALRAVSGRARRSGGRIQLHFVGLNMAAHGDTVQYRLRWELVPMYSASAVLISGVRTIAARIRAIAKKQGRTASGVPDLTPYKDDVKHLLRFQFTETH
ncbi:MYND-type domain-containing protein [Mycena indigotica]|uniref:MYND-type domain-containing protein n=1 Tax=Mycena indigotica TaxID=2126181 RepID=A0A8H6SRK9_9AGAR|nr:MYND-type domain-containing protein [Mycena indigotica]KAF7303431.1 MYND-type domain-containing protein [Mycena indigotica]